MISKLKSFFRLPLQQQLLIPIAFSISGYTWLLFSFFNRNARFGSTVQKDNIPPQEPVAKAKDISKAIIIAAKYTPWKNVCRHQAYQAKILCNHYHIPYLIYIGFKKDIDKNKIQAHAWTIAGGQIITGFCNPDEYTIQTIYSNGWPLA